MCVGDYITAKFCYIFQHIHANVIHPKIPPRHCMCFYLFPIIHILVTDAQCSICHQKTHHNLHRVTLFRPHWIHCVLHNRDLRLLIQWVYSVCDRYCDIYLHQNNTEWFRFFPYPNDWYCGNEKCLAWRTYCNTRFLIICFFLCIWKTYYVLFTWN